MAGTSGRSGDVEAVVEARRNEPVLRVRVRPRSSRRGVLGVLGGALVVGVGAPPERGPAPAEAPAAVAAGTASRLRASA